MGGSRQPTCGRHAADLPRRGRSSRVAKHMERGRMDDSKVAAATHGVAEGVDMASRDSEAINPTKCWLLEFCCFLLHRRQLPLHLLKRAKENSAAEADPHDTLPHTRKQGRQALLRIDRPERVRNTPVLLRLLHARLGH